MSFVIGFGVAFPFGGTLGFGVGLTFFDGAAGLVSDAEFAVFDAVDTGVGDGFVVVGGVVCALVFAAGGFFTLAVFAAVVAGCCALAL